MTCVASFTDAWIETYRHLLFWYPPWSHLLQMRGLKLRKKCLMKWKKDVASFTDAWIETCDEIHP